MKIFPIFLITALLIFCGFPSAARADQDPKIEKYNLSHCDEDGFGVRFLCDPTWQKEVSNEAILVVISSHPEVTLIIARMPSRFSFIEQISTDDLLDLKQYREGFQKERVTLAGYDAIMVKAMSPENPSKRILDYFLIKDGTLYAILCSVSPREEWDKYKFLFKTITDNIQFIRKTSLDEEYFFRG